MSPSQLQKALISLATAIEIKHMSPKIIAHHLETLRTKIEQKIDQNIYFMNFDEYSSEENKANAINIIKTAVGTKTYIAQYGGGYLISAYDPRAKKGKYECIKVSDNGKKTNMSVNLDEVRWELKRIDSIIPSDIAPSRQTGLHKIKLNKKPVPLQEGRYQFDGSYDGALLYGIYDPINNEWLGQPDYDNKDPEFEPFMSTLKSAVNPN
jgi:hypothetical protein